MFYIVLFFNLAFYNLLPILRGRMGDLEGTENAPPPCTFALGNVHRLFGLYPREGRYMAKVVGDTTMCFLRLPRCAVKSKGLPALISCYGLASHCVG